MPFLVLFSEFQLEFILDKLIPVFAWNIQLSFILSYSINYSYVFDSNVIGTEIIELISSIIFYSFFVK